MFQKIGFIGCGTMGSAIAKTVYRNAPQSIYYLTNRSKSKAEVLSKVIIGSTVVDNIEAASQCNILFLGVKPQVMPTVLAEISQTLKSRTDRFILVTMAAGLSCEKIRTLADIACPVIRIMPNTPVSVDSGVIQYCSLDTTENEISDFVDLLNGCGTVDAIDEKLIDAASALSGCGPAFAYLFIEALADGAVDCGLPRAKALSYAAQTLEGAAKMVRMTGMHPGALKDAVCSPGGTTIEGVRALEEGAFRASSMNAVIAAYEKTLRMK